MLLVVYFAKFILVWLPLFFFFPASCIVVLMFSFTYFLSRQSKKAYLLIDFSDYLQISVWVSQLFGPLSSMMQWRVSSGFFFSYVLGAVFLQLCQVLLLADHPVVQKLIDPSLFIHRFTDRKLTHILSFICSYVCSVCNCSKG